MCCWWSHISSEFPFFEKRNFLEASLEDHWDAWKRYQAILPLSFPSSHLDLPPSPSALPVPPPLSSPPPPLVIAFPSNFSDSLHAIVTGPFNSCLAKKHPWTWPWELVETSTQRSWPETCKKKNRKEMRKRIVKHWVIQTSPGASCKKKSNLTNNNNIGNSLKVLKEIFVRGGFFLRRR